MAYDATKKLKPDDMASSTPENPYASIAEDSGGAQGAQPAQQGGTGSTATGYLNFGDYFSANSGVAQREAGKLQGGVDNQAIGAQNQLGDVQGAFTGAVKAGTPGAPTGAEQAWAQRGPPTPNTGPVTQAQPGLESTPTRGGADLSNPRMRTPYARNNDANVQSSFNAGQARAQQGYTGPDALSDQAAYADLAANTSAAKDAAANLGTDSGIAAELKGSANAGADAALLGAANRSGFQQTAQTYGGLNQQLQDANAASQQQSGAARDQSADDLAQYNQLADEKNAAMNPAAGPAPITLNSVTSPGGSTTLGAEVGSPGAGIDPAGLGSAQSYTNIEQDVGFNPQDPQDQAVMKQMTDSDWRTLNSMSPEQQKAWWANKKKNGG